MNSSATGLEKVIPDVAKLVESRVGIRPQSVGNHSWIRALRLRMEAAQVARPALYLQRVQNSATEFQALLELLVVPETWFFRERAGIDYFTTQVKKKELLGVRKSWSILSLGCATGEEPYSIVMAFADAGLSLLRVSVIAVDISKVALEVAKAGVYGPNAFRSNQTIMHRRHFLNRNSIYEVSPPIKQRVKFLCRNIVSPGFSVPGQPFDAIFCRNVLIYFDTVTQQKVLGQMERMLAPEGLIFVGLAKREFLRMAGLAPAGPAAACAFYQRGSQLVESSSTWQKSAQKGRVKAAIRKVATDGEESQKSQKEELPLSYASIEIGPRRLLKHALKKADEGQTVEAFELCREYVSRYGANADTCHLMGTLALSNHDENDAKTYFQKAVYLVPNHYESLVGLAILAERSQNKEEAKLYWERARKQSQQNEKNEPVEG